MFRIVVVNKKGKSESFWLYRLDSTALIGKKVIEIAKALPMKKESSEKR